MNNKERIITLLQFARKANKLVHGFDSCCRMLQMRKLDLLLLASDTADNTKKKIDSMIKEYDAKTPLIVISNQEELGRLLNLPATALLGIKDKGFANKIKEYWFADSMMEEN